MYITKIILDGFKSYATRTEISDFDSSFNAITGLNGSGKSNILDSICFVLGECTLEQRSSKQTPCHVWANHVALLIEKLAPDQVSVATEILARVSHSSAVLRPPQEIIGVSRVGFEKRGAAMQYIIDSFPETHSFESDTRTTPW